MLTKRDDHWNADNYPFSTVTVRVIEDSTALENALRSGEVDVAPSVLPASRASLESVPGIEISEVENTSQQTLIIADRDGTIQPALADVRVRQAINMAFDRENIVANAMNGLGAPSEQVFYPTFDAFDEALNDTYEYDVEGPKICCRSRLSRRLFGDDAEHHLLGAARARCGAGSGGHRDRRDMAADPGPRHGYRHHVQVVPLVVWPDGNDPDGTVAFGHFSPQGFLNPFGSEDPELTEMLTRARAAVSAEEASAVYQEINEWGVENAWSAPIVKSHSLVAAREGYAVVNTSYQIAPTLDQFDVSE
ncbi:hypothetical protein C1I63_18005 [Rathayibacter caricis DSM 15933]|uniref:Solute-binding protein family 5 domain-containing protein n=1 Tax=Rathayibacter caricis DSM 15933 TaxID=1328867 RepID=A0A2T4UNN8_9MICO|nr:hypothetical protein C1I63_18005 [Rathayibacter caricis DSM 15933]